MLMRFFYSMLPYMAAVLPIILLWRWAVMRRLLARGIQTNGRHETGLILFVLLLVGLASQALIPGYVVAEKGVLFSFWTGPLTERLNLVPFHFIKVMKDSLRLGDVQYVLTNIVGNIIIFSPIGFFVPLLWHRQSLMQVTAIGFLSSLAIEVIQLPQDRWTDIDDIILNTIGALLGYALYFVFCKAMPRFTDSFKVNKDETSK
ncbi:MAG: VanZ family protein [Clostridiales bacterium]|nr:VanZ family protein [Clostridiales bacterium]